MKKLVINLAFIPKSVGNHFMVFRDVGRDSEGDKPVLADESERYVLRALVDVFITELTSKVIGKKENWVGSHYNGPVPQPTRAGLSEPAFNFLERLDEHLEGSFDWVEIYLRDEL